MRTTCSWKKGPAKLLRIASINGEDYLILKDKVQQASQKVEEIFKRITKQ